MYSWYCDKPFITNFTFIIKWRNFDSGSVLETWLLPSRILRLFKLVIRTKSIKIMRVGPYQVGIYIVCSLNKNLVCDLEDSRCRENTVIQKILSGWCFFRIGRNFIEHLLNHNTWMEPKSNLKVPNCVIASFLIFFNRLWNIVRQYVYLFL